MKKLLLLSVLLIPFVSFWQNIDQNESNLSWTQTETNLETTSATTELSGTQVAEPVLTDIWTDGGLGLLWFWFCNDGLDTVTKSINAAIEQWKSFKVCTVRKNNSTSDLELTIDMPFATYTAQWDKTCGKDLTFENFIPESKNLKTLTVPAGNQLVKEFDINFPIWLNGKQDGCLVFNVAPPTFKEWQSWLMPRIRKWFFMNFFVWEAGDVKNEVKIENIKTSLNSNKELILNFDVANVGNVENTINISWTISNIFGFKREFEIVWWVVIPERSLNLEANLWLVPSYGWLFSIKFAVNTTPHFIYDISQSNIDPSILEEKVINVKTTHFEMPRLILWIVILVILLLAIALKKPKQKIVYVEKK